MLKRARTARHAGTPSLGAGDAGGGGGGGLWHFRCDLNDEWKYWGGMFQVKGEQTQ